RHRQRPRAEGSPRLSHWTFTSGDRVSTQLRLRALQSRYRPFSEGPIGRRDWGISNDVVDPPERRRYSRKFRKCFGPKRTFARGNAALRKRAPTRAGLSSLVEQSCLDPVDYSA